MTFKNWVAKRGGAVRLAPVLGCTPRCINLWFQKKAVPSAKMMVKIHTVSRKKVSYKAIITETFGGK